MVRMTGQFGCLGRVGRHHQRVDGRHSSTLLGGAEVLQVGGRLVAVPLLPGGAAVGGAEGGGDGGRGLVATQVAVLAGGYPGAGQDAHGVIQVTRHFGQHLVFFAAPEAGQDGVLLVCRRALARPWSWAAGHLLLSSHCLQQVGATQ